MVTFTRQRVANATFALCLLAVVIAIAVFSSDLRYRTEPWMNPVITPEEYKALEWVKSNTVERTVFVTDIFGGEFIMGHSLREGTEGGDWAIVPNVVKRMGDIDRFYITTNASEAHDIAVKYGASFVWAPDRQVFAGFGWKDVERTKFNQNPDLFEKVYDGKVQIYRVK